MDVRKEMVEWRVNEGTLGSVGEEEMPLETTFLGLSEEEEEESEE